METHCWRLTEAHTMFERAIDDGEGRRYAAGRGIAFVAHSTGDGTWHGFPVPWDDVPAEVQDQLVNGKQVTRRAIKRCKREDTTSPRWALKSDEE